MELWIGLWIMCGITAAVIAGAKGRSRFGWFLMGLGFAIFGVIMIACLPAIHTAPPVPQVARAPTESESETTRATRISNTAAAIATLLIVWAAVWFFSL